MSRCLEERNGEACGTCRTCLEYLARLATARATGKALCAVCGEIAETPWSCHCNLCGHPVPCPGDCQERYNKWHAGADQRAMEAERRADEWRCEWEAIVAADINRP